MRLLFFFLLEWYSLIPFDFNKKTLMIILVVYVFILWIYSIWYFYKIYAEHLTPEKKSFTFFSIANVGIASLFSLGYMAKFLNTSDIEDRLLYVIALFLFQSGVFFYYGFFTWISLNSNRGIKGYKNN